MQSKSRMVIMGGVHEKPPTGQMIILAIQHLFGMFGATVLVPILANQAAGAEVWSIGVVFTMSGVGTLIYHLCTRGKSPVYLGSSFAFIAPMVSVYLAAGVGAAQIGMVLVGVAYIVLHE